MSRLPAADRPIGLSRRELVACVSAKARPDCEIDVEPAGRRVYVRVSRRLTSTLEVRLQGVFTAPVLQDEIDRFVDRLPAELR